VIFLWVSYLAAAVAVRRGRSLRITFLLERMPPPMRLACELSMHLSILLMLGFLVWHNMPVIELGSQTRMLATQWKDAVRFWPLTVGCVLIGLYEVRFILLAVRGYRR
jgi:TRAP-type C4-dicarboxylate transport system permease small subunit